MNDRTSELLDAACRVIAQAGAARLRMSDVAREAGVSTALVHYYFATRPELLRAAFMFADARVDVYVDEQIAVLDTAAERLERLLSVYVSDGDPVMRENSIRWREMWSHARVRRLPPHRRRGVRRRLDRAGARRHRRRGRGGLGRTADIQGAAHRLRRSSTASPRVSPSACCPGRAPPSWSATRS